MLTPNCENCYYYQKKSCKGNSVIFYDEVLDCDGAVEYRICEFWRARTVPVRYLQHLTAEYLASVEKSLENLYLEDEFIAWTKYFECKCNDIINALEFYAGTEQAEVLKYTGEPVRPDYISYKKRHGR